MNFMRNRTCPAGRGWRPKPKAAALRILLVAAFALFIALAVVDLRMASHVGSLLDEAARRSAVRAAASSDLAPVPSGPGAEAAEFRRLLKARRETGRVGADFLEDDGTVNADYNRDVPGAWAALLPLRHAEGRPSRTPFVVVAGVMVLRPGECATPLRGGDRYCNDGSPDGRDDAQPAVEAVAVAEFDGILPFLRGARIAAKARERLRPDSAGNNASPRPQEVVMGRRGRFDCVVDWSRCFRTAGPYGDHPAFPVGSDDDGDGYCDCGTSRPSPEPLQRNQNRRGRL